MRKNSALFHSEPRSDASEHCLEVILPFLQVYLKHFELVPLVLGPCDHAALAARLDPLLTSGTLVVASADLSHYLPYDEARSPGQGHHRGHSKRRQRFASGRIQSHLRSSPHCGAA